MGPTLHLLIVTPESIALDEHVNLVTLPCIQGQIGIYPLHVPLITHMVPGEASFEKDGKETFLAVGEGIVGISADEVSIVTDMAIAADNIDAAKAEEARQRAATRLREKLSDEEVASVNASLVRSLAQLQVKRRRRTV